MRYPVLTVASLVAALFLVAGCGQSKEEKFRKDFRPLNDKVVRLGGEVGSAVAGGRKTNPELARDFEGFADRLDGLRSAVDELDAPGGLTADKERLVRAMADAVNALREVSSVAQGKSGARARAAGRHLAKASAALRSARLRLARKAKVKT